MPEKGVFWEGISEGLARKIEEIVEIVPGFGDYLKRENARERDKIIREHIAERYDHMKKALMGVMEELSESGRLKGLDRLDRLNRRLDRLRDEITYASHGYSGFFDPVKILDAELEALYTYDLDMLAEVEEMDKHLEALSDHVNDPDRLTEELAAVSTFIDNMERIFENRKYVVTKGHE
ncbi:MAG: hypothetical protein JW885_16225 [Deltaproteobacteria bacterium]|nr:hypothetical protein [Candidatus Zymogenaceae bacterium]